MPDNDGEPTPADVAVFTQGRLTADDPRTAQLLTIALAASRTYCGWHVTPERVDTVTVDGPGSVLLKLPTLRLVELTSVTENDIELDVTKLEWSPAGMVRKINHLSHHGYYGGREYHRNGGWTSRLGAITVAMKHGFDAAPDFNAAVLAMVDRISEDFTPSSSIASRRVVGPFEFPVPGVSAGSAFTEVERAILDLYALEKSP